MRELCAFSSDGDTEPYDCITCRDACDTFDGQGCAECPVQKAFERLAEYEDADEAGLIAACRCKDCAHKEWRGNSGRVYCPKTHSWRDADDFCKLAKSKEDGV